MSTHTRTAYSKVVAPKRVEAIYAKRWDLFPYLMMVMVLITVVSTFHVWSRVKVVELSLGVTEVNRLFKDQQQENSRLRLEVASLKTPARIEAMAKGELGMALPTDQQVVVVR
jgi:cell division protein FtsL